ncbi:MAG: helix-turn-helix transcriptional regulator [Verrucomicrobia bacterium]|nr:helix-turn-helix transcriptional regulator [Verrucomicrobiota bacterium]
MPRNSSRRSDCPIANALEVLGDRWTLLIVRDLVFRGFREYGQFLAADEGISTNILSERLERLRCAGVVVRLDHPTDGKKFVYHLSEKGTDLIPLLVELVLWGAKYTPNHAAPAEVLREMRTNPERMIAGLRVALLKELAAVSKR